MLSPRWRKVLRDLWGNKTRTALVVLSIAVGVFAVGMIAGTQVIVTRDLASGYAAVNPASATLYTEPFDDDLVQAVRGMREVSEAEGRRGVTVRLKVGPEEWRALQLFAISNYNDIRINKVWPEAGVWPPPKQSLLLERASLRPQLGLGNAAVGDTVLIKTPGGKTRELEIAGLAHDIHLIPAFFAGRAYGYVTFDTLEWLGEPRNYNELSITVAENAGDKEHIRRVAEKVRDKIEKSGRTVLGTEIPEPGKHPLSGGIQAMSLLMGTMGLLALLLSGFLVINTVSALLAQQVRQIGVMKAVGGRTGQIMGMYMGTVLVFSLLSLAVAVPLGALGAGAMVRFVAGLFNIDITSFSIPLRVVALQAAVGLLVPLLAALYPVISGTRLTVREAVSNYGIGKGQFERGFIDRLLRRAVNLPRPLLLSLRNTFRRKGRLALTLVTLTLGGAIFIAVFSVRASLLLTLDDALEYWKYDVQVDFRRAYRVEQIETEALRVPGVVEAESWGWTGMRRIRLDGGESNSLFMVAPPAATRMLQPVLIEGRWLLPEDENAIVINTDLRKEEPDTKVGDEVTLKIEGRNTTWRVVGLVRGVLTGPIAYANYPHFGTVLRDAGHAGSVQVVTERHDGVSQSEVAKALEDHFERAGMRVSSTRTTADLRATIESQFNMIIVFLLIMAILLAVVGGLGLMGTMSINVLERTREIGVMRAIGASDGSVRQIFIVEGILISVISWFVGGVLALPISKLLSDAVGLAFMDAPLSYTFSASGALIWLLVVIILAALASFLPAWNASRISVREVLAYE